MHATEISRLAVLVVVVAAVVALVAIARNGPGVGGRFPDPDDAGAPAALPAIEAVGR